MKLTEKIAKKLEDSKESDRRSKANQKAFDLYKNLWTSVSTRIEDQDRNAQSHFKRFEDPIDNDYDELVDYAGEHKDLLKFSRKFEEANSTSLTEDSGFSELEDYDSFEEFETAMKQIGAKQIAKAMGSRGVIPDSYYPSNWARESKDSWGGETPYPAILAEALVLSPHAESITDIANVYYSRNRKASKEAIEIWKADALKNGEYFDKHKNHSLSDEADMTEMTSSTLAALAKHDKAFMKKWVMTSLDAEELEGFKEKQPKFCKLIGI